MYSFESLDALGAVELVRASPTLDGSVPLRAAQACTPLLDGNRFGFQLRLRQRLRIVRGLAGVSLELPEPLARRHAGNAPRFASEGLVERGGVWDKKLSRGIGWREARLGRVLSLFTGLFVRPRPGVALRVSHAGNRRSLSIEVQERWIYGEQRWVPLVLRLRLDGRLPLVLHGEIANLAPIPWDVPIGWCGLGDAPELGRAHADFFDPRYFQSKKRGPTQKYKKLIAQPGAGSAAGVRVVVAGPRSLYPRRGICRLTPGGVVHDEASAGLSFCNAVPLSAEFDGHDTLIDRDARALERHTGEIVKIWSQAYGDAFVEDHRRALWYFTKYLTPHQPGEPYFFVKPAALIETPVGWSTLIDGVPGSGYDVLRGVVATDRFHAAPAVLRLNQPCRRVRLARGVELARLLPFQRSLLEQEPAARSL